jgi:ATP-dependent DNA ligase
MLHRRPGIPITFMVFDVLASDAESNLDLPYWQRRRLLDGLELAGPHWQTPETFSQGDELFESVCAAGLEGVVAKKLAQPYRPGERLWIKVKNRNYWRYPLEREAAIGARFAPAFRRARIDSASAAPKRSRGG